MLWDSILISPKSCLQCKLIEGFQLISNSVMRYGTLESLVRLLFKAAYRILIQRMLCLVLNVDHGLRRCLLDFMGHSTL
jgi:hypothetical protein